MELAFRSLQIAAKCDRGVGAAGAAGGSNLGLSGDASGGPVCLTRDGGNANGASPGAGGV